MLYKRGKSGSILEWEIEVEDDKFRTISGQQGGAKVTSSWTVCEPKNVGRANETTAHDQAVREAAANTTAKLDEGYTADLSEVDRQHQFKSPMLAFEYGKVTAKKGLVFPVYSQPKLDGCVHGKTLIETNEGLISIRDIVNNRRKVQVKSHNLNTNQIEFRSIVNWFNNGRSSFKDWMEIAPEIGPNLRCTINHKIFTQNGWKEAGNLDSESDLILSDCFKSRQIEMIAGTLLGDSCFQMERRNGTPHIGYRLIFTHTNETLFAQKVKLLGMQGKVSDRVTGYGSNAKLFTSVSLTNFGFPFEEFYDKFGSRKVVTYETLKRYVTKVGLALWIADDGSLSFNNGNSHTPLLYLHTQNCSQEQLEQFRLYFKKVWNVDFNEYKDKKVKGKGVGKFITFSTKDTLYLLNQLRDCHIQGAEYKFYFPGTYIEPLDDKPKFIKFKLRKSRNMSTTLEKFDLEIEGNHNYFANGSLVHNCRLVVSKDGMFSRNGKPVVSAPHILEQLKPIFDNHPNLILDGEIYAHKFKNDFNRIISLAKKTRPTELDLLESRLHLEYHIYDICDGNYTFSHRQQFLRTRIFKTHFPSIVLVKTMEHRTQDELDEAYALYLQEGYEGQMIRRDAPYEFHRSNNLLKRKEMITEEFTVLEIIEGIGNRSGIAGAVRFEINGKSFNSGISGTHSYCLELLNNRDNLVGKQASVRFQNMTPDGVPRFPVMIAVHDWNDK